MRTRPAPGSPPKGHPRQRSTLTSASPTRLHHALHQASRGSPLRRGSSTRNASKLISKEGGQRGAPSLHRSKILHKRLGAQDTDKLPRLSPSESTPQPQEQRVIKLPFVPGQVLKGLDMLQKGNASERTPAPVAEKAPNMQVPAPTLLLIPNVNERTPKPEGEHGVKIPAPPSLRWHALLARLPHVSTQHPLPSSSSYQPTLHRPSLRQTDPQSVQQQGSASTQTAVISRRVPSHVTLLPGLDPLSHPTPSPEPTPSFWASASSTHNSLPLSPTSPAPHTRVTPRPKSAAPSLPSPLHVSSLQPTPNPHNIPQTSQPTASRTALFSRPAQPSLPTPPWMKRHPTFSQHTLKGNRPAR